ncbi:unnamed protein product [Ectocarpus sp. 4 AP-2014]
MVYCCVNFNWNPRTSTKNQQKSRKNHSKRTVFKTRHARTRRRERCIYPDLSIHIYPLFLHWLDTRYLKGRIQPVLPKNEKRLTQHALLPTNKKKTDTTRNARNDMRQCRLL